MDSIAIIVLNWKQPKLTIQTVNSISKIVNTDFNYQIIIVDNNSPDNSLQAFKSKFGKNPKIKLLQTKSNLGYVGGNNFGIKHALKNKFDYVLLINNDVLVEKYFLQNLLSASKKHQLSISGPKIYFAPGFEFHKERYQKEDVGNVIWSAGGKMDWQNILGSNIGVDKVDKGQYDKILVNPDFLSGCCFLIKSHVFQKIGLLDSNYFMYLEDVDFCQKALKNNFKIGFVPDSIIWHINSGSSGSGSSLHDYFITRNRLIFASRYASKRTKFALFRESINFIFGTNQWKRKAVFDYYLRKWGKGSWN